MIIRVNNLVKYYQLSSGNKIKALDIEKLEIEKGEVVGLLGKSGSGKTTLLRILRGVERFDEGTVYIDGIKLTPESEPPAFREVKMRTAIHLQRSFGLWSEKVVENVIRALSFVRYGDEILPAQAEDYEEMKEVAMDLLRLVGLEHKAECWAEILSGGEKQRLILARQLAKNPSILILDEFGTMTCNETRKKSIELIKKINDELGTTIVFSSHMPEVHKDLADRVVLLEKGRVISEGDADEMIARFLSELEPPLQRNPKIEDEIVRLENVYKKYYVVPGGKTLEMKDVNISIRRGEIIGVIGKSGSGKTVLTRLIAGLELPDSGKVILKIGNEVVDFKEFGRKSINVRKKIGILHQEFSLPFWAKVSELIAYRIRTKKNESVENAIKMAKEMGIDEKIFDAIYRLTDLPKDEAEMRLQRLGLSYQIIKTLFPEGEEDLNSIIPMLERLNLSTDILERLSHELSGGEAVRLGIALAAITKPELLILDEPFGDIDPVTLRKVVNVLKEINIKNGTTTIIVSHQIDVLKELADRFLLVEDGRVSFISSF